MTKDDEYRRNAEEARQWAARVIGEDDRVAWLKIAQDWLALIHDRETRKFSKEVRASATNDGSDAPN